ncbi:hypothetical protein AB833_16540 [Chromatiales bacterium (ex Bugula neritina AB1)]|nr:hypothetical protein AB833_16540 [Chromatiales bacterium (ex Bugula neritina AB1)]
MSELKKVIVTEKLHPDGMALLDCRNDIDVHYLEGDGVLLTTAIEDAHAVLVRTMSLPESMLNRAQNLEVVSRHGVGCDNIDLGYLSAQNIPVAIAVDSNTTSVIEHVLMMMLVLNKRAMEYNQLTRDGGFSQRGSLPTSELAGKHVLIVGFGRIGKRVAGLCKAFDMRVTVADIMLDFKAASRLGVETVTDFHAELAGADYLTVHVPLDNSTRGMISHAELAELPGHSIVINCARGGVIDEKAIAQAVRNGGIAGFGSDVFTTEPPDADNPLLNLPNTILTPHNAAGTAEGMRRMAMYSAQNILDHIDGKLTGERIINSDDLR